MRIIVMIALCLNVAYAADTSREEAKAFVGLAKYAYDMGDNDKATEWVNKSVEKYHTADAEELRGMILEQAKKGTEAKAAFTLAGTLPAISGETRGRVTRKLEQIRRDMAQYTAKRQEFLDTAKSAVQSTNVYLAAAAKDDVAALEPKMPKTEAPKTEAPKTEARIVGTFNWYDKGVVILKSDGTAIWKREKVIEGKWTATKTGFTISWSHGLLSIVTKNAGNKWTVEASRGERKLGTYTENTGGFSDGGFSEGDF